VCPQRDLKSLIGNRDIHWRDAALPRRPGQFENLNRWGRCRPVPPRPTTIARRPRYTCTICSNCATRSGNLFFTMSQTTSSSMPKYS
jgi:hypothetical protein